MTTEFITLLAALGAGVVLVAVSVYWWINRAPSMEREDSAIPLFGGLAADERAGNERAGNERAGNGRAGKERGEATAAPVEAPHRPRPVIREFNTGPVPPPVPSPASVAAERVDGPGAPDAAPSAPSPVVDEAGVPGTMVEGHALRYSVPADGTLQFLPGRLEIGSGLDAGREIRFVRVEGPDGIEVTFGRADGALYRHIQLRDMTVSRAHARMHFDHGTWYLQNLSKTNPVVHNGIEMPPALDRALVDGDRIEMGEVMFTFRER